jgi:hypothetical protein
MKPTFKASKSSASAFTRRSSQQLAYSRMSRSLNEEAASCLSRGHHDPRRPSIDLFGSFNLRQHISGTQLD